jgi:hypothetical protein
MEDILNSLLAVIQVRNVYDNLSYDILDHPWQLWRFEQSPEGFWTNEENVHSYMLWISQQLNVECPEDWYDISQKKIEEVSLSIIILLSCASMIIIYIVTW